MVCRWLAAAALVPLANGLLPSWPARNMPDHPPSPHRRSKPVRVSSFYDGEFDLPPLPPVPGEDAAPDPRPSISFFEPSSDSDLFLPPQAPDAVREGEMGGEIGRYGDAGGGRTEGYWAGLQEAPDRLRASDLNELLQPDHLDRLRFANFPMQSYGALFQWDVLVRDAIEVYRQPWARVAAEHNLPLPDDEEVMRAAGMRPERAIQQTFRWTDDWGETQRLAFDHYEMKADVLRTHAFEPAEGALEWLGILNEYKVPCCLCAGSALDRASAELAMTKAGLDHLVTDFVTIEDGCETAEQSFLVSCIKVRRPPERCVVFADEQHAITAAHEVTSKAVAVLTSGARGGSTRHADTRVSALDDLSLMTLRELFKGVPVR
uniref:Uncharacterized protein n=1 Tax=Haptolina brevifila TaxID=156173 RepID=A0A7S2G128_9EUKA|mmetsp:Transcript_23358/g.46643  ORF Transcript_23358/g.46643 Transcript_23358/m.46643 type:complete len:376 (+) Transcript_23358:39-1166(+)